MTTSRNETIDGVRGLSVLLVIIGHFTTFRFASDGLGPSIRNAGITPESALHLGMRVLGPVGEIGVHIFFLISGYLITTLLISEEGRYGCLNLSAFYVRRLCRIMPALLAYCLSIWSLDRAGLILINADAFARTALFVCNFSEFQCSWWLAHTWSLSVEEQFYLAWPVLFIAFSGSRPILLTCLTIAFTLASLWSSHAVSFGHIAIGAMIAASPESRRFLHKIATGWAVTTAALLLAALPLIPLSLKQLVSASSPYLTAVLLFGTVQGNGPLVRLARSRPVRFIGVGSYSLYLWQQLGTAPVLWAGSPTGAETLYMSFPSISILFVVPAVLSYFLVERPCIKLGRSISQRLLANSAGRRAEGDAREVEP